MAGANRSSRCKPVIWFVKALQKAGVEQPARTATENCDFFRKVRPNLMLKDGAVSWMPRHTWQTLIEYGPFGCPNGAHMACASILAGEAGYIYKKRREWDSNPRRTCARTGFRNRRLQPLSHLSRPLHHPRRCRRGQVDPISIRINSLGRYFLAVAVVSCNRPR